MKKQLYTLAAILVMAITANAQVGIGTTTPGSTLQISGSLAPNYTSITAAAYTLTDTDYYVVFNGTADGTFTLPVSVANMKGRIYTIKNTTAAKALTLKPAGSETIDANTSVSIPSGSSAQVVNTGLTGAVATWEVVSFNNASGSGTPENGGGSGTFTLESGCAAGGTSTNNFIITTATATGAVYIVPVASVKSAMDAGYNLIGIRCNYNTSINQLAVSMPPPLAYAGKTFVFYIYDNYTVPTANPNAWGVFQYPIFASGTRFSSLSLGGSGAIQNYANAQIVANYSTGTWAGNTYNSTWNYFGTPGTANSFPSTTPRRVFALVMTSNGDMWIDKSNSCPTFVTYKQP